MIVLGEGKTLIFRGSAPDPAGREWKNLYMIVIQYSCTVGDLHHPWGGAQNSLHNSASGVCAHMLGGLQRPPDPQLVLLRIFDRPISKCFRRP